MTRQQNISSAILWAVGLLVSVLFAVGVAGCTSAEPETGGEPAGQAASQPLDEVLDPKHTVLLVHDMMNDFVAEGGASDTAGRRWNADGVMEPIASLLAAARAKNVRVAYVRWTRQEDGSWDYVPSSAALGVEAPPLAPVQDTWGWEAPEAITPMSDDWIITKTRPDAFMGTNLDSLMRWNGMKSVVMVGAGGDVGILPSALTSTGLGYVTVAVGDGIAFTGRAQETLDVIGRAALVKTHQDIVAVWNEAAANPPAAPVPTSTDATIARRGQEIPNSLGEILNPQHTAILVHAMNNDVVGTGRGDSLMEPLANFLEAARSKGARIVYMIFTNHKDGSTSSASDVQRGRLRNLPSRLLYGTPGWDVYDAIRPAPGRLGVSEVSA